MLTYDCSGGNHGASRVCRRSGWQTAERNRARHLRIERHRTRLGTVDGSDFDLIITARNQTELERIVRELQAADGNHVHVIPADLTLPEAPQQIFAGIDGSGLPVDILINNAGFGSYGAFAASDSNTSLDMVKINIAALTALMRLALPGMIKRKRGRIMNVASSAGKSGIAT